MAGGQQGAAGGSRGRRRQGEEVGGELVRWQQGEEGTGGRVGFRRRRIG